MKYEVWMGFKNYLGEVYDVTLIAQFNSMQRAEQYKALCESDGDDTEVYCVRER